MPARSLRLARLAAQPHAQPHPSTRPWCALVSGLWSVAAGGGRRGGGRFFVFSEDGHQWDALCRALVVLCSVFRRACGCLGCRLLCGAMAAPVACASSFLAARGCLVFARARASQCIVRSEPERGEAYTRGKFCTRSATRVKQSADWVPLPAT
eukprot:scaffold18810_cov118-Isochrysis_galbana.AAC.6